MYIYTNVALQLDPHPPCSSVHYCSVVHYCTSVHYCQLPDPDCQLLWLREGFFCFGKMGCVRPTIIPPAVVQPAIIRPAIVRTIIQPAIALHIVVCFDVEK